VLLAPLTTLGIGGPARYFFRACTEEEAVAAFALAGRSGLDVFVLGGGSNIVVSDEGFDGLVIQIAIQGIETHPVDAALMTAGAGEDWDRFVAFCVANGLAGIECLSGIPGFVGGTPVQNVGAYGQEVSETIQIVRCLDRESGEIIELSNQQCAFAYRTSIFNSIYRNRYVVLSVTYRLVPGGPPRVAYRDLLETLPGAEVSLADVRNAVLGVRAAKSMVIDPLDPNSRSAGSFFKNPVISRAMFENVKRCSGVADLPHFEMGQDGIKIPAAWLIENAGFRKGFRIGNVGISPNHSLALVNRGGATASELIDLKNLIQIAVNERFGITLQPEPVFVGFDDAADLG
jgi:UDP-N-acetylmuramate dehydrogenase